MITLYYRNHSKNSQKAIKWFNQHNLSITILNINNISEKEIFQSIYLSDLEISDILRKNSLYFFLKAKKKKAIKLRFSDSLAYLEKNPYLMQDPIIISPNISLIGYDENKIENFLQNNAEVFS
ncbi:thioredoxin domain-containing protein [Lactococcus garvieae]|uniref:hypothetical protein n=1 Tax=Lactococcus garvieae TaxID=1363 RepID=UPI003853EE2C